MAKKPVSVLVSRGQKKKPIQHISKRRKLKSVLKKIFNYMKSDSYMFAPSIHPQSPPPVSSGEVPFEPMKKEKKSVEEYLKGDDYMYAPLVTDSAQNDGTTTPALGDGCGGKKCDEMETAGVSMRRDVDRHDVMRRIVVEHSLLQRERVKRVVHQNCRPLSATGDGVLSPRKVVVE